MERKNGFYHPENQFLLTGMRLFFKKWISSMVSTRQKKSPNKKINNNTSSRHKIGFH